MATLEQLDPQMRERYSRVARESHTSVEGVTEVLGVVTKEQILQSFAAFYGLDSMAFSDEVPAPAALLGLFSPDYLKHHSAVPVEDNGEAVTILMERPQDIVTRDDLAARLPGRKLKVKVGIREDIHAFIDRFYGTPGGSSLNDLVRHMQQDDASQTAAASAVEEPDVKEDEVGIVRLVNQIIEQAVAKGASDIHFEPYPDAEMIVRLRVDGLCREYTRLPRRYARAIVARIKIMSGLDIAERRLPQDGKIKYRREGCLPVELRVSMMPTQGELEDVVLRVLAASKPVPLAQLKMRPAVQEAFEKVIQASYGLILCVGPTGSGKTTTLHSALGALNTPDCKIWTAEDPVEITQRGVRQVQIHHKIGLTFERALRGFLRLDPDVIMIGEMRDLETANAAVEASLTGHLVLSTLHTNNAPETITRLLDMGLDPFSFGDSLLAVLAQRLVRTLCANCWRERAPEAGEAAEIEREFGDPKLWATLSAAVRLATAEGCEACGGSGYKGRMAVHELMVVNPAIRHLVYSKGKAAEIRDEAIRAGMWTLKQDGIQKVMGGHTDMREVRRVACA